jgi:hypothetical protein
MTLIAFALAVVFAILIGAAAGFVFGFVLAARWAGEGMARMLEGDPERQQKLARFALLPPRRGE